MDFANSWPNSLHLCLNTILILLSSLLLPCASVTTHVSCLPDQSSSLLQLKRGFFHSDLASWQAGTDCCHGWDGVSCDEATVHVTSLDISNRNIQGNLSAAIFNLTSLQHLNLAYNNFSQNQIPANGFQKLTMLTHLNLTNTYFFGQIPIAIANLTNLISLDFSCNSYYNDCDLKLHDPNLRILVSQLRNLRELYLDRVDISENGTEWCTVLSESVPRLQVLSMAYCNLSGPIESSLSQLSKLAILDLSDNSHSGSIPPSLFSLRSLELLYLYNNNLSGQLRLNDLSVSFSPLIELDLSGNQLNGTIPWQIFKFSNLKTLYLSGNQFSGTFDLNLLRHLRNLTTLLLSDNQLSVEDVSDEQLSLGYPQIISFGLASCNLTQIPRLLRYVGDLFYVDLSKNQLHGVIPTWIWKKFTYAGAKLILSNNMFTSVEDVPPCPSNSCASFHTIDFSFNRLKGALPLVGALILDYCINEFSEITSNYTLYLEQTTFLGLSGNMLTGEISSSICEPSLIVLDLSDNNLSGSIPSCIIGSPHMQTLSLRGNNFSGILSRHISRSCALIFLDLNSNNLNGNFPRSLTRCKDLALLDIGNNRIGGTFPFSLGKLPKLQVIVLRNNRFYGTLDPPSNFGKMDSPFKMLRVIDLASNNFNGSLPPLWFNNFKSMQNLSSDAIIAKYIGRLFDVISVTIMDKGVQRKLENNLPNLMISIDLSTNRFTGDIPNTIGELKGIKVLNLSHNAFTGSIPHRLGQLTQIESLDLSWNNLSREIPQELISLNFLSFLNLSFNHLVGRIPQSGQFLAFDNSSFEGNLGLCGVPLSKLCNVTNPRNNSTSPPTKHDKRMTAIVLLGLFVGLGFGTGFGTGFAIIIVGPKIKRARNEHVTR